MTSLSRVPDHGRTGPQGTRFAVVGLLALAAAFYPADAIGGRRQRSVEFIDSRAPGEPVMAIVSLRSQQITVYDAKGWIVRAPVSSGQRGRETPAGIFSIIQKNAEHYSNLYDDAYMPHMQRITWSGIALHGGVLPGHAASHGCVRMPFEFAAQLFDATQLGMRVIVAPHDVTPVEMRHPSLPSSQPGAQAIAAARAAEAEEATRTADRARLAAVTASREAAQAMTAMRVAENLKLRAEAELASAENALGSAVSPEAKNRAEDTKAKVIAGIAELEARLAAAKAALQPKLDVVAATRQAAVAAEAVRVPAAEAARAAARELEPMSVFISRKTQRLYVRRAFEPVMEVPVTIADAERPIGTHVFTAMERNRDAEMRWSVVTVDDGRPQDAVEPPGRGHGDRNPPAKPVSSDAGAAKAALDRIVIPPEVLEKIAGLASPRSSLIVSDEGLSSETGKGTDFIVLLSGEPQGSLKMRRRGPAEARYEYPFARQPWRRSPYAGPYSTW
ncbi:MAG: L,D-transpeptidase [Alphaproteobacteria bacterium]|nr:MAG: L,D-transpeptidase [Alphaproteobacteria bacterium]